MAPFTHLNRAGSRFSDGSYGVYYAADSLETAVAETAYHFARIATDSADAPRYEPMRVLAGPLDCALHDVSSMDAARRELLFDPTSYTASQPFGAALRDAGSNGIHYPSVRRQQGSCVAVFRPRVVPIPRPAGHLVFHWDGARVVRYFDYARNLWTALGDRDSA
jgi:RES domain-containing protein